MKKYQNLCIWIFAILFTAAFAHYQRSTGPTYPVKDKIMVGTTVVKYELSRSGTCGKDEAVKIKIPDTSVHGEFTFKRYKSNDSWTTVPMMREREYLTASVPQQPMAGKVEYKVTLLKGSEKFPLSNDHDIVIRFKRSVPLGVLIFHIFVIFSAMLLSTVTGLQAIFKGKHMLTYTWLTVIFFIAGGCILGPVVQKYAFDAYWTGWPFGHDLTDNKTLLGLIFWVIALIVQYRKPGNRTWPVVAAIVFLVVYLIPHSVLGSEIDYTKQAPLQEQGRP
ncbi:MAG: hypothetical protein NTU51_07010 [Bacteroidetes bacterium]|nr:hypothetical protein [Bacteroidota bacterium]